MSTKLSSASLPVVSVAALLLVPLFLLAAPTRADEPLSGRALLIGIENYDRADKLQGVVNDVDSLRDVLEYRGGYKVETVKDSAKADSTVVGGVRSEAECLKQRIEGWLAPREKSESVILYFSGHGFRDEENHLYLAAQDCDPSDPKPGGIPISWLRDQLAGCSARSKLLVLDACHGGNARSTAMKSAVTAKELQDVFEQTAGLVTLASCTGDQQSYLWPAKHQSIFTYWLVRGLCGNADREPLGEITINELDSYVQGKVRRTAEALNGLEQTPTRLQGPNVSQDVLFQVQPVDLQTLLDDLAEQLDVEICPGERKEDNERWIGVVPEFASDVMGERLGREYGALATQCPVELANRLAVKSNGAYHVLNTNAIRELLQSRDITGKDIGTEKCKGIEVEGHSVSCLVVGQVQSLKGSEIALQCKLVNLATGEMQGIASGTAKLCASELAMQGTSGRLQAVPSTDRLNPADNEQPLPDGRESARIDGAADHPLRDPAFPFGVKIVVRDAAGTLRVRPFTFSGNDCHVQLAPGELFHIRYHCDRRVFAKVLVDGLNTLAERSQTKGIEVESALRREYVQAQPVSLAEARAWGPLVPDKVYTVEGFYLKTGADAAYDEFKVVDAKQSLAAEAGFTDQLGLITVAFYEPQIKGSRSRGVGTGRGDRYRTQTEVYSGPDEPGRLLAVVHIRYGQ